ncbi:Dabb family protein [Polyangium jinanense]|uniref:Dabb family protein n=1 Tax=Polyangium jinanense TaxID=2829994 RepID=A0A9X3X7K6_9BACT|nr:Dabb family protein [Polyangium jinanense]MDC3959968.1 Dabb family protein [Polyangium jinanense]MDC3983848.1 Dabb family protein [Polyangium jinanense]
MSTTEKKPVEHLVILRWKSTASESAKKDAEEAIASLPKQIPGIDAYVGGRQNSPEAPGRGWDFGFRMTFRDIESRDVYLTHPVHVDVKTRFIEPIMDAAVVFDFEH